MNDRVQDGEVTYKRIEDKDIYIKNYYLSCEAINNSYTHIHFNIDSVIINKALILQPIKIELWMDDKGENRLLTDIRFVLTERIETKVTLRAEVTDIETWSAEIPKGYTFRIVIKDDRDREICETIFEYAFRFIDIRDSKLHINGQEVMLNGVVYNNDAEGKLEVLQATYLNDIKIFKRNNINAVITYDYNNAKIFYDMCNKHGIYVIKKPIAQAADGEGIKWDEEKTKEIIHKYINHPCIIMWALDSRVRCFNEPLKNIKGVDNSRPVYYESNNLAMKQHNRIKLTYDFMNID